MKYFTVASVCVFFMLHFMPFLQVRCIWPIRGGVLLERQVDQDGGYDGLPTLFTLLHPMDDFCPVTCRRPAASKQS